MTRKNMHMEKVVMMAPWTGVFTMGVFMGVMRDEMEPIRLPLSPLAWIVG